MHNGCRKLKNNHCIHSDMKPCEELLWLTKIPLYLMMALGF